MNAKAYIYVYFKGKHGYEKVGYKIAHSSKEATAYMRKWMGKSVKKADRVTRESSKMLGHIETVYVGAIKFEISYRDAHGARL